MIIFLLNLITVKKREKRKKIPMIFQIFNLLLLNQSLFRDTTLGVLRAQSLQTIDDIRNQFKPYAYLPMSRGHDLVGEYGHPVGLIEARNQSWRPQGPVGLLRVHWESCGRDPCK